MVLSGRDFQLPSLGSLLHFIERSDARELKALVAATFLNFQRTAAFDLPASPVISVNE